MSKPRAALVSGLLLSACVVGPPRAPPTREVAPAVEDPLEQLKLEGQALAPLMKSDLGRAFVSAAGLLERQ